MGLHTHLDIRVCGGGDSLAVVKYSVEQYRKRSDLYGNYSSGLILLDDDRIEEDKQRGRDPFTSLAEVNLNLIRLVPNLEGVLLRLHPGSENRSVPARIAKKELQKKWPEYHKPMSAIKIHSRFTLQHLQRAARTDINIRRILEILGLPLN